MTDVATVGPGRVPGPGTERVWQTGRGAVLVDVEGRECVDLAGGAMTQSLGHCHPEVVAGVQAQAAELENVHDGATPARARAARRLRHLLPAHLDRLAFLSTGAEVVEAALRVVHAVADPARRRVAALRHGFHGKTRGARSLVQWDVGGEAPAAAMLGYPAYCYRCPFGLRYPSCELLCARLTVRQVLERGDVAALVAEPVQGAGGVVVPPPGYWEVISEGCARLGVLLVADEVLTGGGRTGRFLASEAFGIEPDLVTLAKGIGSGYPVAALAARSSLLTDDVEARAGGFSASFAGSPVGLAAAAATLEVLARDRVIAGVPELAAVMAEELRPLSASPIVGEVRQLGVLCGIELVADRRTREPAPALAAWVADRASCLGTRVMATDHVIRLAPPLVIDPGTLSDGLGRLRRAIGEASA